MKKLLTIICALILGFSTCYAGVSTSNASTATHYESLNPMGVEFNLNTNSYDDEVPTGIYRNKYNDRIVIMRTTVKIVIDGKMLLMRIVKCSHGWITLEYEYDTYKIRILDDGSLMFDNERYFRSEE